MNEPERLETTKLVIHYTSFSHLALTLKQSNSASWVANFYFAAPCCMLLHIPSHLRSHGVFLRHHGRLQQQFFCLSLQRSFPALVWACEDLCWVSPPLPKGISSTLHNPTVTSSHPVFSLCWDSISLLLYSTRKSQLWADPYITMSRAAICVLTGSAGGTLWIAAKTIHSHRVPHTPMLFHSFILETRRNGIIHHWQNCCKYFSCSLLRRRAGV